MADYCTKLNNNSPCCFVDDVVWIQKYLHFVFFKYLSQCVSWWKLEKNSFSLFLSIQHFHFQVSLAKGTFILYEKKFLFWVKSEIINIEEKEMFFIIITLFRALVLGGRGKQNAYKTYSPSARIGLGCWLSYRLLGILKMMMMMILVHPINLALNQHVLHFRQRIWFNQEINLIIPRKEAVWWGGVYNFISLSFSAETLSCNSWWKSTNNL